MEIKVDGVASDSFKKLQDLVTSEQNLINWGSAPNKAAIITIKDCRPGMRPSVTVESLRLVFDITLEILETSENLNPIPREKINQLIDTLKLFK